jgi:HSP20 family protein
MDFKDLMPWPWSRPGATERSEGADPFRALQAEINRAFESFQQTFPAPRFHANWGMSMEGVQPRIDVADTDSDIEITAELPGLDENDVEITMSADSISIKGEKRPDRQERRRDFFINERAFGAFRRTIALPGGIDTERVSASFKNGVLTIIIPKTEQAQKDVKRIAVNKG